MIRLLRLFGYVRQLELQLQQERDAQTEISRQVFAERELRKAADERAERYHDQSIVTYQAWVDWLSVGPQRKKAFGKEEERPTEKMEPIPVKPSARSVAREISSKTLRDLHEELKKQEAGELPVLTDLREGPEYSAAI